MAQRGRPLDVTTVRAIQRLAVASSIKGAARQIQVSRNTVRKYVRKST